MTQKNLRTLALGAAIAGSLAAVPAAQANPFSLTSLGSAYLSAGEGNCGGNNSAQPAEGKCGGAKKAEGEMKCGADKAKETEGKCGEGKCGANMKEGDKKDADQQTPPKA
jgi:uncharacterized low-complexity protein